MGVPGATRKLGGVGGRINGLKSEGEPDADHVERLSERGVRLGICVYRTGVVSKGCSSRPATELRKLGTRDVGGEAKRVAPPPSGSKTGLKSEGASKLASETSSPGECWLTRNGNVDEPVERLYIERRRLSSKEVVKNRRLVADTSESAVRLETVERMVRRRARSGRAEGGSAATRL